MTKRILALLLALVLALPMAAFAEDPNDPAIFGEFAVKDLNGDEQTQALLQNAPLTLVNIWGTFCPPCIEEMPILAELSETYKGKVQFLGVVGDVYEDGVNQSQDIIDEAIRIAEDSGASCFPHLIPDPNMMIRVLSQIQFYPTTFCLDKDGKLVGELAVGGQDKQQWIDYIEAQLQLLPPEAFEPAPDTGNSAPTPAAS